MVRVARKSAGDCSPALNLQKLFSSCFRYGIDADLLAGLVLTLELDDAVNLCVQGIIITDANVQAGMDLGAALANQNVASQYELTIAALGAKTLSMAVAAVTGGTHTLLMSEELKIHLEHYALPPFLEEYPKIARAFPLDCLKPFLKRDQQELCLPDLLLSGFRR